MTRSGVVRGLALLAAVGLAGACTSKAERRPAAGGSEFGAAAASDAPSTSQAERTRRMEAEAAELSRRGEEVQAMEGTPEEKERAMNELLQRQQELERQGESGGEPPQ